jgi:hypothetical protein
MKAKNYITKEETYQVSKDVYKLYHMVFLLASKLKTSNTKETNDFWIKEIQNEINNK